MNPPTEYNPDVSTSGGPVLEPVGRRRWPALNLGGRFARGLLWNLLSALFTQGSSFVTAIILARLLGKSSFGEFAIIQTTLLTLVSLVGLATGLVATKYVAEFRDTDKARAGRVLGMCSVLTSVTGATGTLLLIAGAPLLAEHVLRAPHLALSIALGAPFVMFFVLNGYQVGALAGLERFRTLGVVGAITGCAHVALAWIAAVYWGLEGALAALSFTSFLRWWVYNGALKRDLKAHGIEIQRRDGMREREILMRFAMPAALSGLTLMPSVWLGNAFLVRQPGGYAEMGLFSAANTLRILVLFLPQLLNGVTISVLNNQKGLGQLHSYKKMYVRNLRLTVLFASIGAVLMLLLGEWALRVFGSEFAGPGVRALVALMALSVVLEATGIAVYQLIQGHQKMWWSLCGIVIPRDLLYIAAAYFLTAHYGAVGLAGTQAIAFAFGLLMTFTISYKLNLHNKV